MRKWLDGGLLLILCAMLFRFPDQSMEGARRGLTLCAELLIPSLFPFFVLSSLFIATGLAGLCAGHLEGVMRPLFGVGGSGAVALVLGLVGGYPVGARTVAQLVGQGTCSVKEANRLALFCNNCGPAFFLGAVGVGIFGSLQAGIVLLTANAVSALLLGIVSRIALGPVPGEGRCRIPAFSPISGEFPACVNHAFSSTLGVCAYVILFSVLVTLTDRTGFFTFLNTRFPEYAPLLRSLITGLLEISTGTAALRGSPAFPLALPTAAFLLGWGGFSVHCQSLPFWKEAGVKSGPYLAAKLCQGLLSALLTFLALSAFPLSVPAMARPDDWSGPSLLTWEILALWMLSGLYFLFFRKKDWKRTGKRGILDNNTLSMGD